MINRRNFPGLCLAGALLCGAFSAQAQLAERTGLTLAAAKNIANAAEKHAMANKWNVVIAIMDEGGHLLYLQRMDETQVGSVEVAIQKARSAVLFKRPTKAFEDAVAGGRTAILQLPGAMPVEGGLPIEAKGRVIGSVGVSGVTSQQDAEIATAGIAALQN